MRMSQEFDEQFDVVVIGVGAAGAAAALSAYESGARVLVIDKCGEDTAGGNTRISGSGWFINSDPERAAVFLRALADGYSVAEDVVETWAAETAKNSDWMRSLGAQVAQNADHHTQPEYVGVDGADCYAGMDTVGGQMGNFLLYDFFIAALVDRGIEVRFSTRATELITDVRGAVVGVVTEAGGQYSHIGSVGGVVLATGGFAADPQMVRDYLRLVDPPLWGSPNATGDGHRMAQKVGADLWHMDNMMTITGIDCGSRLGLYLALWAGRNYLFASLEGRRFIDEIAQNRHGHISRNGSFEHFPLQKFYLVFDERMRSSGPLSPGREMLPVGWKVLMDKGTQWSADNMAEIEAGIIKRAATISDLARLVGIDPSILETTVAQYNAACEKGQDDHFGRSRESLAPVSEPPFYVLEVAPLLGWSSGGPRRDGRSRVVDPSGAVIDGLHAAGEVSSTYSWRKDGGFHIADALAFGRVAGREAAGHSVPSESSPS
ncbi:FAD-dependent oxidoreductase [Rhodococcus sp. H36-A4]|nr:FAD-dependent oxidoreductase [Rhodococcus sp. H36-A4]MCZ4077408.1 FAD-dependent oxidoreductase [Rhodococcus sp. H36-A4]